MGRPLKFNSPEELQEKIDRYFKITPDEKITITGLAVFLNCDRETLTNYENRDNFFDIVKDARNKVAQSYEESLKKRGNAGDIFALKNFGWTDRTEIEQNIKGDISLSQILTEAQNRKKLTSGEDEEEE